MEPIESLVAMLGRWSAGRGPLYLLLAARFRQLIDEGLLPPGAALPPDRTLAAALAVGRTTVVTAYDTLRQEGRIVRRQGSGTQVAAAALAPEPRTTGTSNPLFLHLLEQPDDVILLSCAAPDGPPEELARAYASITLPTRDLGYHPVGLAVLREALAARYTARGIATTPGQILVTTGAQQALSLLTRLLVAPGDPVLVEAPTYPGALDLLREAAAALHPIPVGPDGVDVDAAIRAMTEHRPVLSYVIASYQNPTGAVLPPLAARRLVAAAAELGLPLVDDEVLADLTFSDDPGAVPRPLAAFGDAGEVISVGSLSKVAWGGLRVGWVRGPVPLISRLARLKAIHDLGTDVPAQLAAVHLLSGFEELRERRVEQLRLRHDHLRAELARRLPSWRCPPAAGGQTLWVELPHGDGVSFAQIAMRHGVAVLPGTTVDALGGSRPYLRLHFATSTDLLTEAVRRLAAAWQALDGTAPTAPAAPAALHGIVV
ncbi:aminotransferase class I/II-fold pyridoxal phosphate-dependent enzyme [Streptomyces sp. 8N616]|uniref:aminotransferase class I/II-fold pyridoxal phosphate-dependent enzyme n=1 Tax=Streptomyces sp. 8N616 TaxID=3457414 RepID=UPI003FD48ACE